MPRAQIPSTLFSFLVLRHSHHHYHHPHYYPHHPAPYSSNLSACTMLWLLTLINCSQLCLDAKINFLSLFSLSFSFFLFLSNFSSSSFFFWFDRRYLLTSPSIHPTAGLIS